MWHHKYCIADLVIWVLAKAQLSPIRFSATTFSRFFCILIAWDSLSCLVGAEGLELPISAQLIQQEQQLLRQWFHGCFEFGSRDGEYGCLEHCGFIICTRGPSSTATLAGTPFVPLEELCDLMVLISGQLSAHLGSNPLAATLSGSPLLGPPSLSPLLGDPHSAMLLTTAGTAAQHSLTTAFLPPPATVMTPGLSSPVIATICQLDCLQLLLAVLYYFCFSSTSGCSCKPSAVIRSFR